MKTLVIYDSVHGNTEAIARAVGGAVAGEIRVLQVGQVSSEDVGAVDLLILGSPTLGGRPTETMQRFLKSVPQPTAGGRAASFDTRFSARWVRIFGFAADRMASALKKRGWTIAAAPQGFTVDGREGPLRQGEAERAAEWAGRIAKAGS